MTIIVMGHLRTAPGEIERLHEALSAMLAATNAEPGCEHYSFARHVDDPDTLIISERWASAEALAEHGASDHMKAFNQAVGGAKLLDVSVKSWDGTFLRTLVGE